MVVRKERILGKEDSDAGNILMSEMKKEGVEFLTKSKICKVEKRNDE
jgi:pyruvate/2-oxoglutarate dehydrogenase complex dihydrolipoamide dehydrogenase (E3) component